MARANAAKATFLARASHELRTRLNAIVGYSELVRDEMKEADDRRRDSDLRSIRAAGLDMLETLDTMTALATIQAGSEEPESVALLDVPQILDDVIALARPVIEHNGNRIDVSSDVGHEPYVGDAPRLKQILFNLLVNAGRRTRNGDVRLAAHAAHGQLRFEVADTGSGIPPEQLADLFRPFTPEDAAHTTDLGGGSLGLALSRRLCSRMGGEMSARSETGQGSLFTVAIPAQSPAKAGTEPVPGAADA
jgi:signal transduction histidine kinase